MYSFSLSASNILSLSSTIVFLSSSVFASFNFTSASATASQAFLIPSSVSLCLRCSFLIISIVTDLSPSDKSCRCWFNSIKSLYLSCRTADILFKASSSIFTLFAYACKSGSTSRSVSILFPTKNSVLNKSICSDFLRDISYWLWRYFSRSSSVIMLISSSVFFPNVSAILSIFSNLFCRSRTIFFKMPLLLVNSTSAFNSFIACSLNAGRLSNIISSSSLLKLWLDKVVR